MDDDPNEVITRYYVDRFFVANDNLDIVNNQSEGKGTVVIRSEFYNPYEERREEKVDLIVEDVGIVDSRDIKIDSQDSKTKNFQWNTNKYNVDTGNYTVSIVANKSKSSTELYIEDNGGVNNGNGN